MSSWAWLFGILHAGCEWHNGLTAFLTVWWWFDFCHYDSARAVVYDVITDAAQQCSRKRRLCMSKNQPFFTCCRRYLFIVPIFLAPIRTTSALISLAFLRISALGSPTMEIALQATFDTLLSSCTTLIHACAALPFFCSIPLQTLSANDGFLLFSLGLHHQYIL